MEKQKCPNCSSTRTVWRGYRRNNSGDRHLRKCNACGKKYTPDDGFLRMRFPKEIVLEAVSLYQKGFSTQEVVTRMKRMHGVELSRWIIIIWYRKFGKDKK